jgi:hypothetical protein
MNTTPALIWARRAAAAVAAAATAHAVLHIAAARAADAPTAAELFKEADLPLGEKLLREHRCDECHSRQVGGDGTDIYNPQGRINAPGALRGMVEQCNLQLNLALFPDEVTAVSAVLNRRHYRFR